MRAVLVSGFPDDFVRNDIIPELERRDVEVIRVVHPYKVDRVDISALRPDIVFHMTEWGSHAKTERLAKTCRQAGIALRSLSRKKAAWADFLPAPRELPPPPPNPRPDKENRMNGEKNNGTMRATLGDIPGAKDVLAKASSPPPAPIPKQEPPVIVRGPSKDATEIAMGLLEVAAAIRELAAVTSSRAVKHKLPRSERTNHPISAKVEELVAKFAGLSPGEYYVLLTGAAGGLKDAKKNDLTQALRRLADQGKIRREGAGGPSDHFRYFPKPKS